MLRFSVTVRFGQRASSWRPGFRMRARQTPAPPRLAAAGRLRRQPRTAPRLLALLLRAAASASPPPFPPRSRDPRALRIPLPRGVYLADPGAGPPLLSSFLRDEVFGVGRDRNWDGLQSLDLRGMGARAGRCGSSRMLWSPLQFPQQQVAATWVEEAQSHVVLIFFFCLTSTSYLQPL